MTRFQTNYYILKMSTPIKYYKTFTFISERKERVNKKSCNELSLFFQDLTNVHALLYILYNLITTHQVYYLVCVPVN